MKSNTMSVGLLFAVLALSLVFLTGCGSGSGDTALFPGDGGGTISGRAMKGPVADARVTAYAVHADGTMGEPIGSGQTDQQGNYSVSTGAHSGPVYLEVSGGHYMDEATLKDTPMNATVMTAMIPHSIPGEIINGVQITPLTSMAQALAKGMPGGMSETNAIWANDAVGRYFEVGDVLHTPPVDTTVEGACQGTSWQMKNYGMTLGAMSMYAFRAGIVNAPSVVDYMMEDAFDGHMDGMMGGHEIMHGGMMGDAQTSMPPDWATSGLADAMYDYMHSSQNRCQVTDQEMQQLMDGLRQSDGTIQ